MCLHVDVDDRTINFTISFKKLHFCIVMMLKSAKTKSSKITKISLYMSTFYPCFLALQTKNLDIANDVPNSIHLSSMQVNDGHETIEYCQAAAPVVTCSECSVVSSPRRRGVVTPADHSCAETVSLTTSHDHTCTHMIIL